MKKFFGEFKKFITRGNVVDMAVGVIVGSAFTAIVNGLSNNILKPIINYLLALIFDADSLSEVFTVLKGAYLEDGTLDLANSIYIDWGAFINAVLNFFIVTFVLFCIVRFINKFREEHKEFTEALPFKKHSKADRKAMRALGIKLLDKEAVEAYYAEKAKKEAEEKAAAEEKARLEKEAAEEQARLEREANPTAEDLLKEIRDLLKSKNA